VDFPYFSGPEGFLSLPFGPFSTLQAFGALMESFERKSFTPHLMATGVGSLPHPDAGKACALIARTMPRTPFWPQLPKQSPLENMNIQISPGLPFLKVDEKRGEVHFDGTLDEAAEMERVYQAYLSGKIEDYGFPPRYAAGFEGMMQSLQGKEKSTLQFFKGQVVGPITFGLSVQDEQKKDVIHNEIVFDALLKGLILRGRWIIQRMKTVCPKVLLFLDEPGLSGYGSAFFSVDEGTITSRLNEVIEDFQSQGALVGVHCCGNTDWSVLLKTKADIINFDAWGFFGQFSLYLEAIKDFLSREGILAWGIVPTSEFTGKETVESLRRKLEDEFRELSGKGIPEKRIREKALLTSSCGMGLMSLEDAEKAMILLSQLSEQLRKEYL